MTRTRLLVAGMLLAAIACGGEPTAPRDATPVAAPQRIAVGDTVVASFASTDSISLYSIQPAESVGLALFVQAEEGNFNLSITDSVTGEFLGSALAQPDPVAEHLTLVRSDIVQAAAGRVLLVRVYHYAGAPGRLRFWVYGIKRAPEILPNTITVGDTLEGEILENTADIDEFVFSAAEGDELIAYIQGEQGTVPSGLGLQVLAPSGETIAGANNTVGDVELEAQPSGVFQIPASGSYRVAVGHFATVATPDHPGIGGFRVLIRRIDRHPEQSPAVLAAGDTLSSAKIDFVGDIDEFQVPVIKDSLYNVFLQTLPAPNRVVLHALVISEGGDTLSVTSTAGDSALAGQFSGTLKAGQTGSLKLEVAGHTLGPPGGLHRGGYRIFVYPINREPELATRSIAAGDSLTESIEYPGDIDHFTVGAPGTGVLNLVLYRTTERTDFLDLYWTLGGQRQVLNCYQAGCGSGTIVTSEPLPVEVASQLGAATGFRGTYRLVALPIDGGPESRPKQFVIGDVVTGEITPIGDADTYEFSYSAGDLLELQATGGSGISTDGFTVFFHNPAGQFMVGYADFLPTSTGRFTLPAVGTYQITIQGSPQQVTSVGPYSFTIRRFGSLAETVTAPLAIGDSVGGETIGQVGDVDDFILSGPAGAEVQVFLRGTTELQVDATVAGASTPVRTGSYLTTGRLTLPASGQLGLRVYEPRTYSGALRESNLGFTGPYSLAVHAMDRNPETLGSTLTLGSTQDGEAIDFEGDIDEFSFSGTAGQSVSGTIQAPFGFDAVYVRLLIIDPNNGQVLGSAQTWDATVGSTGTIVLPATGTYRVRVASVDDTRGRGGYRFLVQ